MNQKTANALLDLTKADYNADGYKLDAMSALNVLWEHGLYDEAGRDALDAWMMDRGFTKSESPYSECQSID